jgi:phenylalanyl-tRNA synthetase beta chain
VRIPLSWLREWADPGTSVEEISRRLTSRGFPVEGTTQIGHEYANVVVGHVLEVARHPDADKLSLCKVDGGTGEILNVVCGAPNVVAGMKVPLALVGAELPGGLKIKRSKIRGAVSEGMLCSARELELGGDHSGILALRDDAPVGRPVREMFGEPDVVLDVEVAYNRPDALCMAGIAREVAAAFELPLSPSGSAVGPWARFDATVATGGPFPVRVEDPVGCPRYLAQVVRGVKIGPSPVWLQERLERAGMRPISNVVDATNYVLLEMGHPLHAFDLAKLAGPEIVVRRAKPGEKMTTLDGKDRVLSSEHLVIADRDQPTVIAGVMGAAHVEVTDATTDLLLEAAWFDPVRIQRAVSDHGILSEAARRYGRGVDPALAPAAMARALELILELAGGRLDGPATDAKARSFEPLELELRPAHAARLLGARIGRDRMARDLAALGFGVVDTAPGGGDDGAGELPLVVTVPTRRRDVTREVDLIEEVARAFGYDRLPDVPLVSGGAVGDRPAERRLKDLARQALIGLGFSECMTPSLDDPERLALTWPLLHDGEPRLARIRNAAGPETSALRSDLLSGLLRVAAHNLRHGADGLRLFEVGKTFVARGPNDPPVETTQLVALVCGSRFEVAWDGGQAETDFFEAKGLWEAFLARLGVDRTEWAPYPARGWKSGEAAELRAKARVACAGRLSPLLARRLDLEVTIYLFAAELDALGRARRETTRFTNFPRLPGVRRDVAFFLPADVPHGRIESLLRKSGGALLAEVRLFDVYQGKGVPEGKKSLAYTLTFQAADRTLQESEIESLQRTMVETLGAEVGAVLRDR